MYDAELIMAVVGAAVATLAWLFRLEGRVSAHELVCAQRQLQLTERQDRTNHQLADLSTTMRALNDKIDRALESR